MNIELHPAAERGHFSYGWLDTYHNFSFGEYFNPVREQFGALRVLNDDIIQGGAGFDEHPHDNMEIITIPLSGHLLHRDSLGQTGVIGPDEVQVMSAGKGIFHSEYNHSKDNAANFLQIWIYTRNRNALPRCERQSFEAHQRQNTLQVLVSPDNDTTPGSLWICQDAWISRVALSGKFEILYELHRRSNRVFVFVIDGNIQVSGRVAGRRDALGISGCDRLTLTGQENADVLLIEIPDR